MTTILLMGHGSQDPEGAEEFCQLAAAVRAACADMQVEAGFLEFAGRGMPSIQESCDRAVTRGETRFIALPILLHEAGHSKIDMPAQVTAMLERYPGVQLTAARSLGIHPALLDIVEERIDECGPGHGEKGEEQTAVLLVGRGSSDPEANADFFKVGRLLWERRPELMVECSFISLAPPSVASGIERCAKLGAQRILVIPYFINTGVLVKRIATEASVAHRDYPVVRIEVGSHLSPHPKLVAVILDQAWALAERTWPAQFARSTSPATIEGPSRPSSPGDMREGRLRSADGGADELSAPPPARQTGSDASSQLGTLLVERYGLAPERIEALSMARVAALLGDEAGRWTDAERMIASRMVYAAGDPRLAPLLRFYPGAADAGIEALRRGRPIVVDVRMVEVALDHARAAALGCAIHCRIDDSELAIAARRVGLPRAVVAMRALADELTDAVVVIGNAPTALLSLLDLVDEGTARPALIVGVPVGFVAAAESKDELRARDIPYVTIEGTRGGSALAAAATNALLRLATLGSDGAERDRIVNRGEFTRPRTDADLQVLSRESRRE